MPRDCASPGKPVIDDVPMPTPGAGQWVGLLHHEGGYGEYLLVAILRESADRG